MPRYSNRSKNNLATCHPDLQTVFHEVIKHFDVAILEGHRSKERQNRLHAEGKSQLTYPQSEHNAMPSNAVDVAPWPIDWQDRERFTLMAGFVQGVAAQLHARGEIEHLLRWGGDWDKDTQVQDNGFDDLPHFELYKP